MNDIMIDIRRLAESIANSQVNTQSTIMVEQLENHRARARMIIELIDANEQPEITIHENGNDEK